MIFSFSSLVGKRRIFKVLRDFFFDFVSPYAWLAFTALPRALAGIRYRVHYHPVVLGAVLQANGQLGPAEIPGKREWTYRQVLWLAKQQGTEFQFPASHPFNSLELLRLAVATSNDGEPNHDAVETIFKHVWSTGLEANDPSEIAKLHQQLLGRPSDSGSTEFAQVKRQLREQTQHAIESGLFGVPSLVVDDQIFWGLDSLPMLRAYLQGDPWFQSGQWRDIGQLPVGIRRASATNQT